MTAPVVPGIPAPPAGYGPLPADLTAWVTTPFSFLASTTVFRGQLQGGGTLPAATLTQVMLDTILEDPWGGWSAGAWTVPAGCAGFYEVTLQLNCGTQAAGSQVQCDLFLNGSRYQVAGVGWGVTGHASGASGWVGLPLVPGDTLEFFAFATSATSFPTTAGQYPAMEISWQSA